MKLLIIFSVFFLLICISQSVWAGTTREDRVWPFSGSDEVDLPQSAPFGPDLRSSGYNFHCGVDIPVQEGTKIYAISNGTVRIAGDGSGFGYSSPIVQILHTDWNDAGTVNDPTNTIVYCNYLYIDNVTVSEGQPVSAGDLIGYSSTTPAGTELLHFATRVGGTSQRDCCNPWKYLPNRQNNYSTFTACVRLTVNSNSEDCNATVSVTIPPDQLTFNSITLYIKDGQSNETRNFDMCADNYRANSLSDSDDPFFNLTGENLLISPEDLTTTSLANGEWISYNFTFINIPTTQSGMCVNVSAEVFNVFGNSHTEPSVTSRRSDRVWPVNGTNAVNLGQSSPFGPRVMVSANDRYDYHRGVDIPTPAGTPIYAIDDGVVRITGDHEDYQDMIVQLWHRGWEESPCTTFYSNYIHMLNVTVEEGQHVNKGDLIGHSNASLTSGFEHIHFEIRAGGFLQRHACNPWKYLPNPNNDYSTFTADVRLTVNSSDGTYKATVNVSVPPDQLTFNRIELYSEHRLIRTFDMCEDNFHRSFEELDNPLIDGNILISPSRFTSSSYPNGEWANYDFHFFNISTTEACGTITVKVFDIFENTRMQTVADSNTGNGTGNGTTEIVITVVALVNDLQRWPDAITAEDVPEIIWSLEMALINLVQQENFTFLQILQKNITLIAERIELQSLQSNGRGFFTSRRNGSLLSITGDVRDDKLSPEEIGLALLPASLFESFTDNEIGIFFSFYENALLFPVDGVSNATRIGSPVVAATVVVGEQTSFNYLREPVTVAVRLNPDQTRNIIRRTCVSWNFSLADGRGNWSSEGCVTVVSDNPDVVTCLCDHLTNFAVLVDICTRTCRSLDLSPKAELALDIISIIGIVLSMLGLILTIITLLAIKTLRLQDATKFHIQLCIAIFCMLLVFVIGIDRVPPDNFYGGCVAVSGLIQYFTLVAVMWMGAEALLVFEKLVITFFHITNKRIIAASIICWTLPILAVAVPLGINRDFMLTYDDTYSDVEFCFIGDIRVFYGAFLGPIGAILIFNFVMFVMVAYVAISHRRRASTSTTRAPNKGTLGLVFRLTGVMFLFGLTWVFGALTIRETSLTFQILFAVFNSFQGLFLFLFFCVLNDKARNSWIKLLRCCHHKQHFQSMQPKANKLHYPLDAIKSTAEMSHDVPNPMSDVLLSASLLRSDQIDIGPEVAEMHLRSIAENPVTVLQPGEMAVNGITIVENHNMLNAE